MNLKIAEKCEPPIPSINCVSMPSFFYVLEMMALESSNPFITMSRRERATHFIEGGLHIS